MTRCEEFYEKVEKDGNFCGMKDGAYRDLMRFKEFQAEYPDMSGLTEKAAQDLISEPNEDVKVKAIEVIAKQLKAGEKVTGKVVKEDLINAGHEKKEIKETIYNEAKFISVTEEYVTDMLSHGAQGEEILRRVKKALIFGSD